MATSYITAIGTANPDTRMPQQEIAGFMADALQFDSTETRKLNVLYRVSGINYRHTVLPDFAKKNGDFTFFPNTPGLEPFPGVQQRMEVYKQEALPLSLKAVKNCFDQIADFDKNTITHIVTVSCTGMYAPGLDIELIEQLELPHTTQRTAVNFMGCYAAFNALKLADAFVRADKDSCVLIVCTELCTLHFQKSTEHDHLLSNALFADGAAAVLVQGKPGTNKSLELNRFHCELAPQGKQEMAWHIGNTGFEMTLSSYVPELIKLGIKQLTDNLLQEFKLPLEDIELFAIHPGGRKILETIEAELGLSREHNRFAYQVLQNYGNMSSVTVLFVLKELLDTISERDAGKPVLSCAFGPGLTLESMLLTVCMQPKDKHFSDYKKMKMPQEVEV